MTEQLETLLQLVGHLRENRDTIYGRTLLLKYARTASGAGLALLFRVDEEKEKLCLLAYNGLRSRLAPSPDGSRDIPESLPLHGHFGEIVGTSGLHVLSDLYADERSLAEECSWTWPGGHVVACSVGRQGILLLCFAPDRQVLFDEGTLLLCTALLSQYLVDNNESPSIQHEALYSQHIEAAIDRERERIARDIHDGPAQQIAAVSHRLEYIQRILVTRPQDALREIERARMHLDEGLHDLRQCITSLIPAQLQYHSLADALQAFQQDDGHVRIIVEGSNLAAIPTVLAVPVYRFVQEALNNVRKHAQATQAIVRVRLLAGLLVVEVRDNGTGFDSEEILNGHGQKTGQRLGLQTMRERVRDMGGTWEIHSTPGTGTTVRVRFPLPAQSAETPAAMPVTALTGRERDVLRLVIDGLTNRAIAEQLSVSTETVKTHVHHIMQKMNAKDRTHVAVLATRQHWI